jgi:hypothetical protein
MQSSHHVSCLAAAVAASVFALGSSAYAQVSVTSPTENEVTSMPVWLRADAVTCNGYPVSSFGYSYGSEPFMNWGFQNADGWHVDTVDFRLASQSPQATYTVHFKAWGSDGSFCPADVDVNVAGNPTTLVKDVNYDAPRINNGFPNSPGWQSYLSPDQCGTPINNSTAQYQNWFWMWDDGTAGCTYTGDSITYGSAPPNGDYDGKSRLFYIDAQENASGYNPKPYQPPTYPTNPGERYSIDYDNDQTANSFVYDTYIYIPNQYQKNIDTVELDTNWVQSDGSVTVLALECNHEKGWEYTVRDSSGQLGWIPGNVSCDPQSWSTGGSTPDGWHHVQLAGRTDGAGNVSYDFIVVDGFYSHPSWTGNAHFTPTSPWNPGDLVLNFQVDMADCSDGTNDCAPYFPQMTAAIYTDGMQMLRGVNLW